ncbi:MAG: nucleoside triphosphate pyrophosphohydrolase [Zetaproteobacteria bacterium]|nr:nucleoside triphosphate pyrophosphohydrolase [Zetaproteobacteria bacterium]
MPNRIRNEINYFNKLKVLMNVLRNECSWDKKQTLQTLRQYTLEEVHEVLEAVDFAISDDDWQMLEDELGDLLMQILFYAEIAKEKNKFDLESIIDRLVEKMIYRHPHVFAEAKPDDILKQWEDLKSVQHSNRKSLMDGIPPLPALSYAKKQQSRAARVGFDWEHANEVIEKMYEELGEFAEEVRQFHSGASNLSHLEDELGDVLFTVVNLARKLDLDAELCLMQSNRKFAKRFRAMEQYMLDQNSSLEILSLTEQEKVYQFVKKMLSERKD